MKKLSIMLTAVAVFICIVVMQTVPAFALSNDSTISFDLNSDFVTMSSTASAVQNGLSLMGGYDANGNNISMALAVAAAYSDGRTYIEASYTILSGSPVEYAYATTAGVYDVTYVETNEDLGIVRFYISNDDNFLNIPVASTMSKGETVTAYYFYGDSYASLEISSIRMVITDIEEGDGYYLYDYELLDKPIENYNTPMLILNDSGEAVGFVSCSGNVYSYIADPSSFGTSAATNPDSTPDEPTDPGDNSNNGNDSNNGNNGNNGNNVRDTNPETNWPVIIGSVVGAAVIIGAIIFIVSASGKNKKKKTQTSAGSSYDDGGVTSPYISDSIPETIPVKPSVQTNPVREPVSEPVRVTPVLYGEGGEMDGRRYALGDAPSIVIGRAATCAICYKPDAPGISREHCIIKWNNGVLSLMDNGSSNGTYLRGTGKLAPQQPVALKNGDVFYLGEKKNAFKLTFE